MFLCPTLEYPFVQDIFNKIKKYSCSYTLNIDYYNTALTRPIHKMFHTKLQHF